jgi:hypothetical protein
VSVTYEKSQRDRAKRDRLHLVTIDALGVAFQGPVDRDEAFALFEYLKAFLDRRRAKPTPEPEPEG